MERNVLPHIRDAPVGFVPNMFSKAPRTPLKDMASNIPRADIDDSGCSWDVSQCGSPESRGPSDSLLSRHSVVLTPIKYTDEESILAGFDDLLSPVGKLALRSDTGPSTASTSSVGKSSKGKGKAPRLSPASRKIMDAILDSEDEFASPHPRVDIATLSKEDLEKERQVRESEAEDLFRRFLDEERAQLESAYRKRQYVCGMCDRSYKIEDMYTLDSCSHRHCTHCLRQSALSKIDHGQCARILCEFTDCGQPLTQRDLKDILSDKEYDTYTTMSVLELIENSEQFAKCPNSNCGNAIEIVQHSPTRSKVSTGVVTDSSGRALSAEAQAHRDDHRFLCRSCTTEFCEKCRTTPYHTGYTCEQYAEYLKGSACRFCGVALTKANKAKSSIMRTPSALYNVCNSEECLTKRKLSCGRTHKCGHVCGGIKDEKNCLTCLVPKCIEKRHTEEEARKKKEAEKKAKKGGKDRVVDQAPTTTPLSQDGDSFCNICWTEGLSDAPSIQLDCGHVFHYSCTKNRLEAKWTGVRMTFGFRQCPLCSTPAKHPALDSILEEVDREYQAVRTKALERLQYEGKDKLPEITEKGGKYYNKPEDYAMDRYAYYPCFKCKQPYYAGEVVCERQNVEEFDPSELVCGGCSDPSNETKCGIHGREYIQYKCRFCCSLAVWFCWGTTHFCEDCHKRASTVARLDKKKLPKCSCDRRHPPNGAEHSYGCSLCNALKSF